MILVVFEGALYYIPTYVFMLLSYNGDDGFIKKRLYRSMKVGGVSILSGTTKPSLFTTFSFEILLHKTLNNFFYAKEHLVFILLCVKYWLCEHVMMVICCVFFFQNSY